MKEADFQRQVLHIAEIYHWHVWHVPAPSVHAGKRGFVPTAQGAGLPDLILMHDNPPTLIFAELKGTGGRLSEKQQEFLRMARLVGERAQVEMPAGTDLWHPSVGAYVWKPGDEEIVEQILRSKVLA